MSATPPYGKELTPTRVKAQERGDVDINRLVKHGAGRISTPAPVYADLTELPSSRGEAAAQLTALSHGIHPQLLKQLLSLTPAQAFQALNNLRTPASNANDKTNAKEQVPESLNNAKPPEELPK